MTSSAPAGPVPADYRVGDWIVDTALAEGAFGSVYSAHHVSGGATDTLPERAALKFLPTGTSTPRQLRHLRELIDREVELLSRVQHVRLIRMYETLTVDDPQRPELDGATVLVLELAERSLAQLLDAADGTEGPPPGAATLLLEVCEGMAQLHHEGWVHGDIKPSNVLLMADGSVRLSDFNLAAELEGSHAYSPAFSTPDYSPPELLWAEFSARGQQIRPTADVWAYGVLAHIALTGTYPVPGGTANARREALARYARGEEELRLSPTLSEGWTELIGDCLARTHEERAGHDAATLAERVAALAEGRSVRRRLRQRLPRLPRTRRGRLVALTASVATVVTAGTGASLLYDRSEDPPPQTRGYERCLEGNVCFFTEPDGKGDICSWWGDDKDWYRGEIKCDWREDMRVASVFNNGIDGEGGEQYVDVRYFGETDFGREQGCVEVGTRKNLGGKHRLASHRWQVTCADPYEQDRNASKS